MEFYSRLLDVHETQKKKKKNANWVMRCLGLFTAPNQERRVFTFI